MATDAHSLCLELGPGLAIAPNASPAQFGTLGCIIRTSGRRSPFIAPGVYFLTNYHVITYAVPNGPYQGDGVILQPEWGSASATPAPIAYRCGKYVYGVQEPDADCAICSIHFRRSANNFPKRDWHFNHRRVRGLGAARVGDVVYKFGARSGYTKGIVVAVEKFFSSGSRSFQRTIQIVGADGAAFCGPGDSGSIIVRKKDDVAVGLLFLEDTHSNVGEGESPLCREGYAYDLLSQLNHFVDPNGTVSLV